MLNILFIKRDDIIKRTPYGGNIDPDKLVPFIKTAQDKYILPILGFLTLSTGTSFGFLAIYLICYM